MLHDAYLHNTKRKSPLSEIVFVEELGNGISLQQAEV
jgi:hypothetical protein